MGCHDVLNSKGSCRSFSGGGLTRSFSKLLKNLPDTTPGKKKKKVSKVSFHLVSYTFDDESERAHELQNGQFNLLKYRKAIFCYTFIFSLCYINYFIYQCKYKISQKKIVYCGDKPLPWLHKTLVITSFLEQAKVQDPISN